MLRTRVTVWKFPISKMRPIRGILGVTGTVIFMLVEDDPNDVLMLEMEFRRVPAHIRMVAVQ